MRAGIDGQSGVQVDDPAACEFSLIRYVPDPVKNEFVNIGVLLRGEDARAAVRFTRDWSRVRCMDPDADTAMLEALEGEVGGGWRRMRGRAVASLEDSFSNAVQVTEAKACLAESFAAEMESLMRLYVDSEAASARPEHWTAAIQARMRTEFEQAGVWELMQRRISAARYTRPGDPLQIDCGYRPNGVMRMFQAVSLAGDVEAAKVLAFSRADLRQVCAGGGRDAGADGGGGAAAGGCGRGCGRGAGSTASVWRRWSGTISGC